MQQQQESETTTSNKRAGFFKLNTLKSYAILLVVVFALVILCLNLFSYVQNTRQLSVSREISEIRVPVSLRAQDVLIGLNQASSVQRGFVITGDKHLMQERQQVWEEKLLPALTFLSERKSELSIPDNISRIEKLETLLPEYQRVQEEIDQQVLSFSDEKGPDTQAPSDSLEYAALSARSKKREQNQAIVSNVISEKVLPLQKEIREVINPLVTTQEEELQQGALEVVSSTEANRILFLLISVLGIGVAGTLTYFFIKKLRRSISSPTTLLEQLAEGKLANNVEVTQDELNEIVQAGNRLSKQLASASTFAKSIGEGDFNTDFSPASKEDTLGNALVQMRDQLSKVAEEDKRRNWTTSGLAKIGDLLRDKHEDAAQLYFNIVRFIVGYLNANQGGLFLIDEENQNLELVACYAYERQKFLKKTIDPGEGLIGQAFVERAPIFLTEVPANYVQITSGLGDAVPRCILIVPLKVNEEVSGVVELASFKVLEDYEVEFVNKLAETIASAISSIKVNQRTTQLLEETQQQAEEMRAQEEEMRQNNEELQATQEEMHRKGLEAAEQNSKLKAVLESTVDAIITIDERGTVESINQAGLDLFGYEKEEVIGQNVKMLTPDAHRQNHDQYLKNYRETGARKVIGIPREEKGRRKDGSEFDLSLAVNEAFVEDRRIFTGILRDISQQKKMEKELKKQVEDIRGKEEELRQHLEEMTTIQEELESKSQEAASQHAKMKAILDSTVDAIITIDEKGIIQTVNPACEKLFGYTSDELTGQNVKMLTPEVHRQNHDQYLKNYRETGAKKVIGIPREEKGCRKDGSEFPLALAVNEARFGDKRIFTGILRDITQQKEMEMELQQQLEEARATEEEIRQNMEELTAIQEDLERKNQEVEMQHAKMKAILDSTVDAIITINEKGIISTVNPACTRLFGYEEEEMVGQNVKMLMPQQHGKQHDAYLKNYRDTGVRKIIGMPRDEKGRRKDGSEFHLALAVNEARFGNERIFTGILRDITEQKEMEAKLQKQLEETTTNEEELRQAMEELTAIQEDLESKNRELSALQERDDKAGKTKSKRSSTK